MKKAWRKEEGRLPFESRPDSVVHYAVFVVPRLEDVLCAELHLVSRTPAAALDAGTAGQVAGLIVAPHIFDTEVDGLDRTPDQVHVYRLDLLVHPGRTNGSVRLKHAAFPVLLLDIERGVRPQSVGPVVQIPEKAAVLELRAKVSREATNAIRPDSEDGVALCRIRF